MLERALKDDPGNQVEGLFVFLCLRPPPPHPPGQFAACQKLNPPPPPASQLIPGIDGTAKENIGKFPAENAFPLGKESLGPEFYTVRK